MNTEFDIGDTVWYGYPKQKKGKITAILIEANKVQYQINNASLWESIGKSEKEARIGGIKSDLKIHKRYIAKLEKELEELEK